MTTSPLTRTIRTITAITSIADEQLNRYSKLIEDGERLKRERIGDALQARAGGPLDLSRCASQPQALITIAGEAA